jgi:hypothetical protein
MTEERQVWAEGELERRNVEIDRLRARVATQDKVIAAADAMRRVQPLVYYGPGELTDAALGYDAARVGVVDQPPINDESLECMEIRAIKTGREIRRMLRALKHPKHDVNSPYQHYGTDKLRQTALDHAGFCWSGRGEMAPDCCCEWSDEHPEGPRLRSESAEARQEELDAEVIAILGSVVPTPIHTMMVTEWARNAARIIIAADVLRDAYPHDLCSTENTNNPREVTCAHQVCIAARDYDAQKRWGK